MSTEETVNDLVDKAIEEFLNKSDSDNEEIKKRKPKPFRYLTDEKEIKEELRNEETPVSIMSESQTIKIANEKLAILGLGDIDKIENVIRRHEASRKFNEK